MDQIGSCRKVLFTDRAVRAEADARVAVQAVDERVAAADAAREQADRALREATREVQSAADRFTAGMREAALTAVTRPAIEVHDGVYAEPHTGLQEKRTRFAAYLSVFDAEGDAS